MIADELLARFFSQIESNRTRRHRRRARGAQQARLARVSKSIGLPISIEAGGALCGAGSGAVAAQHQLQNNLHDFLQAGGTLSHVMLESVFSRTTAACGLGPTPNQTHAQTAAELAGYAATLKKEVPVETWKAGTAVEVQWGIRYNHGASPLPPERLSLPASTVRAPRGFAVAQIYRR